jgi:putative flippase GtrA
MFATNTAQITDSLDEQQQKPTQKSTQPTQKPIQSERKTLLLSLLTSQFTKYLSIGLLCTLLTWLLWNALIYLLTPILKLPFEYVFSISQYLAAFLMIFPSFYLNRRITFASQKRTDSSRITSVLKAYAVYLLSPLVASLLTFALQSVYRFEAVSFTLVGVNILFGRFFLQGLGLACSMFINFFGQKFWIYGKSLK